MPYCTKLPPRWPSLVNALFACTADEVRRRARQIDDTPRLPAGKADLVAHVQRQFEGPGLQEIWKRLDETQQAAVAECVYGKSPAFDGHRFKAKYGRLPDWGSTDRFGQRIVEPSLLSVFFVENVVPEDLRQRLRAFVPAPAPVRLEALEGEPPAQLSLEIAYWNPESRTMQPATEEVPIVRRAMERVARHDLHAVLQLIEAGKVAVSDRTQLPGKAALRAIGDALLDGDFYDEAALAASEGEHHQPVGPIRAFAWPLLVQAGGLAERSGKNLRLGKAGRKALSEPAAETLRRLWTRWSTTTLLDELSRIDCIRGQTGKGKSELTAVGGRRKAIQTALAGAEPGRWLAADALFRYIVASGTDFEVTLDPWRLYIEDPNYGSLGYYEHHDWHILQGRYALCLLFEYAATLGLIDVAYVPPRHARPDYGRIWGTDDLTFLSRYDGLLYLRLTPLGAYCLGITERYEPVEQGPAADLRVLPNLEVVATGAPPSPADRLLLDGYLVRKGDAVWALEQGALLAALEGGRELETLRGFLEARSAGALPETVQQFLQDAHHRAGQLHDSGLVRLIECGDPALAAQIANDSRTRHYCLQAGERHLVVFRDGETRFRSALRRLGYMLPK